MPALDAGRCSVIVKEERGGYLAARYLIDQGAQRLAVMGIPFTLRVVAQCLEGAHRAVAASAITLQAHKKSGLNLADGRVAGPLLMATSTSNSSS